MVAQCSKFRWGNIEVHTWFSSCMLHKSITCHARNGTFPHRRRGENFPEGSPWWQVQIALGFQVLTDFDWQSERMPLSTERYVRSVGEETVVVEESCSLGHMTENSATSKWGPSSYTAISWSQDLGKWDHKCKNTKLSFVSISWVPHLHQSWRKYWDTKMSLVSACEHSQSE